MAVGAGVGVRVLVGSGVLEGIAVLVGIFVFVGAFVRVGVVVFVAVLVNVGDGPSVAVSVGTGDAVRVSVAEAVQVGDGRSVSVALGTAAVISTAATAVRVSIRARASLPAGDSAKTSGRTTPIMHKSRRMTAATMRVRFQFRKAIRMAGPAWPCFFGFAFMWIFP